MKIKKVGKSPQVDPIDAHKNKTICVIKKCFMSKTPLENAKIESTGPLYRSKFFLFHLWGSWYSFRPAWTHGFNASIGFQKDAVSPEISANKCQKLAF